MAKINKRYSKSVRFLTIRIRKNNDIVHEQDNQNTNLEKLNKYRKTILNCIQLIEDKKNILLGLEKEEDIIKLESDINSISEEISNMEEIILTLNSQELDNEMNRLNRNFGSLENVYTSKLLKSIYKSVKKAAENNSEKIEQQEKNTTERLKALTEKVTKDTNEITGNMLFSIAAIFLGISLISAIIECIKDMPTELMLFFFSVTAWIALTVITISALILRSDDKKFKKIRDIYIVFSVIMGIITIFHIMW